METAGTVDYLATHEGNMTQAEKLHARLDAILKSAQNNSVQSIQFAIVDGQPVWWSISMPLQMEGYRHVDSTAVMVEFLSGTPEGDATPKTVV